MLYNRLDLKTQVFFTKDQAEVKKANKAFEALNVQVNSLARDTITGRLFKQDAENLRKFTKVLKKVVCFRMMLPCMMAWLD